MQDHRKHEIRCTYFVHAFLFCAARSARNSLCQFRARLPPCWGHMLGASPPSSPLFTHARSTSAHEILLLPTCKRGTLKHEILCANFVHASSLMPGAPPNTKFAVPISCTLLPSCQEQPPNTKFAVPISCAPRLSLRWPHARSTPEPLSLFAGHSCAPGPRSSLANC